MTAATRAGYTTISTGTMAQLVAAIAGEACNVPSKDVRANLRDDQGQLSVSLAVPLALWDTAREMHRPGNPAGELEGHDGGSLFERAAAARVLVASRIQELAGATVRRVDIRYTGIHRGDHANAENTKAAHNEAVHNKAVQNKAGRVQ